MLTVYSESLDPLYYSTNLDDVIKRPVSLTLRRLSDAFGMSPQTIMS
jgi:hypothetical protein